MLYVCVLCASCGNFQCCVLYDLQFVNAGRGCNRRTIQKMHTPGSKRHSLQAVELSQRTQAAVQIVSNLPAPSNGGPIYRFLGMPAMRTPWMAGAAAHARGDVTINLGPTTWNKQVWICDICHKQIHRYLDLPSTQRIQTHTPHRHNTTPPLPTLVQASNPLPTYTTHITATKTQTHVQHSPCPHRIGKAQTQFSHPLTPSPPTPPRAKHTHMSHTPPTPLTTLNSSTSPVLDKTPVPCVPLIHALTATTPPPDPTQALPSASHPHTLTAHTHAYKQQYMHHSHRNNRTHNIGYYDNLTNRPRTTTGLLTPHKHTDPAVKVREIPSYCMST